MAITKETILNHTIRILNEEGLDRLTMRHLADCLNIKAASLYWHIKNKDELLILVAEHISKEVNTAWPAGDPRIRIKQLLETFRMELSEVHGSTTIFNITPPDTPARTDLLDSIHDALKDLGVSEEKLKPAGRLLFNFALSFVADQQRLQKLIDENQTVENTPATNPDYKTQFENGVDIILDGIEMSVKKT